VAAVRLRLSVIKLCPKSEVAVQRAAAAQSDPASVMSRQRARDRNAFLVLIDTKNAFHSPRLTHPVIARFPQTNQSKHWYTQPTAT